MPLKKQKMKNEANVTRKFFFLMVSSQYKKKNFIESRASKEEGGDNGEDKDSYH